MPKEKFSIQPVTKQEISRRKNLVAQILVKRKERVITPLITADLVRKVRREEYESYGANR